MSQLIPQDVIEKVRQESNIVDIVGQYVQLKKSGRNHMGLCPFHGEKTPSFSVSEDKQIFHCFGCGKGGNVFKFIQEIEGLSFPDAVQKVAEMGHLDVSGQMPHVHTEVRDSQEQRLIALHEEAEELYHHILMNTQSGEAALDYLLARGLTKDILETFKIGFAPKERVILQQIFKNRNVSDDDLSQSGLMIQTDSGEWLDRFYQRIMFPIRNQRGKVIGFSGRILADETFDDSGLPKYLNSPETKLFNKRVVLFNFDKARGDIRKKNEVILFEGFMDVISAWKSGVQNGVASMGTSLTKEQIAALERTTDNAVICYDGDSAGIEATVRAIELLSQQSEMQLTVVRLPNQMDPDDYRVKYGEDALKQFIRNNRDTVFVFKKEYLMRGKNMSLEADRLEYIDQLLLELAEIPSIVEQDMYATQIAEEFDLSKDTILLELQKKKRAKFSDTSRRSRIPRPEAVIPQFQQTRKIDQVEKAERLLVYRLLNERRVHTILQNKQDFSFVHDAYQELYLHLTDYISMHDSVEIADFLDYLQEDRLKQLIIDINYMDISEESSSQEIDDCLFVIAKANIRSQIQEKLTLQKEAVRNGDKQRIEELTFSIIQLQKELKSTSL